MEIVHGHLIAAVTVSCIIATILIGNRSKPLSLTSQQRNRTMLIITIGLLLWPSVWISIVKTKALEPYALAPFMWPIIILSMHLWLLRFASKQTRIWRNISVNSDASTIVGLTFGIAGFLGMRSKKCAMMSSSCYRQTTRFTVTINTSGPKNPSCTTTQHLSSSRC